jgi:hypothetical protein
VDLDRPAGQLGLLYPRKALTAIGCEREWGIGFSTTIPPDLVRTEESFASLTSLAFAWSSLNCIFFASC